MFKKCINCNKRFKIKPCNIKRSKFCSKQCHNIFRKGKHFFHSKQFKKGHTPWNKDKEFTQMIGNTNGFKKGMIPWNKGIKYLQVTGSKHPFWKGGKIIQNGYWHILDKKHPKANSKGYVKYSHVVMEKILSRPLKPKETVHHINGNKLDDRPKNLQLFKNNSIHLKFHHKKKSNYNSPRKKL